MLILKTPAQQVLEASLGRPLAEYLREQYEGGRTQAEIAADLGVLQSTLSRWMRQFGVPVRYTGRRKVA